MFKVIKSKLKPKLEDAIEDIGLYTVSQKTTHYNIVHNFAKCLPIFNFYSLTDSLENMQQNRH